MEKLKDTYSVNDKKWAPFLMAASFQGLIKFKGSNFNNGVLYWLFSTPSAAHTLLDQFNTKTEPHIPAKDIFEATETWWKEISGMKNGRYQTR